MVTQVLQNISRNFEAGFRFLDQRRGVTTATAASVDAGVGSPPNQGGAPIDSGSQNNRGDENV